MMVNALLVIKNLIIHLIDWRPWRSSIYYKKCFNEETRTINGHNCLLNKAHFYSRKTKKMFFNVFHVIVFVRLWTTSRKSWRQKSVLIMTLMSKQASVSHRKRTPSKDACQTLSIFGFILNHATTAAVQ